MRRTNLEIIWTRHRTQLNNRQLPPEDDQVPAPRSLPVPRLGPRAVAAARRCSQRTPISTKKSSPVGRPRWAKQGLHHRVTSIRRAPLQHPDPAGGTLSHHTPIPAPRFIARALVQTRQSHQRPPASPAPTRATTATHGQPCPHQPHDAHRRHARAAAHHLRAGAARPRPAPPAEAQAPCRRARRAAHRRRDRGRGICGGCHCRRLTVDDKVRAHAQRLGQAVRRHHSRGEYYA